MIDWTKPFVQPELRVASRRQIRYRSACVTPIARVPDTALLDPAAGGVSAGADFLDKSKRRYQEWKD